MMLFPVDSKMIKLPVLRPRNRALALESRILFDGAAAVVAAGGDRQSRGQLATARSG